MASTDCSEAFLAIYLHAKSFSVSKPFVAHVMVPLSSSRPARSRSNRQMGYFCSGRLLGCLEFKIDKKKAWNGTKDGE